MVKSDQNKNVVNKNEDRRASDILQTMADMSKLENTHSKFKCRTRRGRKPNKTEICHLKPNHAEYKDIHQEIGENNQPVASRPQTAPNVMTDWLRVRPELTVTLKSSKPTHLDPVPPLDLTTTPANPQEVPQLVQSTSSPVALVLKPEEYENLAPTSPVFATYAFLPSLGVFVHPLAIPPELAQSTIFTTPAQ